MGGGPPPSLLAKRAAASSGGGGVGGDHCGCSNDSLLEGTQGLRYHDDNCPNDGHESL